MLAGCRTTAATQSDSVIDERAFNQTSLPGSGAARLASRDKSRPSHPGRGLSAHLAHVSSPGDAEDDDRQLQGSPTKSVSDDGAIRAVSHTTAPDEFPLEQSDSDDPFQGVETLPLDLLIEQVQARNPSLAAVQAAWGAAAQKYPQAVALDDPMFQSMYAPESFGSSSAVPSSYYLGIAQKIPWKGKRGLRGQQADWEASAASLDIGETTLRLAEASRVAFLDYYLNERLRELLESNTKAATEFRSIANAKYEANQVTQQDVLQADVELAQLEQLQVELDQERLVAIARINTLLHRRPDHPLPAPPQSLPHDVELPAAPVLRNSAIEQRPELQAMAARVQAQQTAVDLACKDFLPDFEFMGRYDRFWLDKEQQAQVGMNVNIPLNRSRRHAAVQEAMFQVQKLQSELDQASDNIQNDVQSAYVRVQASVRTVKLYDTKILPTASENLATARAGYTAGTIDFLRLIDAQREMLDLQEKHQMAIAELHRRWAELERAVGGPVATLSDASSIEVPNAVEAK